MLTLKPRAWYSGNFRIFDGDREVALLDQHWFYQRASFEVEGATYVA